MAEFAAMPLFTDSWVADTAHLTRSERGMYMDLLVICWRSPECRVPNDMDWIYRKLGCRGNATECDVAYAIVQEFMTSDGNWLFPENASAWRHADWMAHPCRWDGHGWRVIRMFILHRDHWTCRYCGSEANHVDHIIPRSRGGRNTHENLNAACSDCNWSKGDKLLSEWVH
jgi:ribosomal protein L37E